MQFGQTSTIIFAVPVYKQALYSNLLDARSYMENIFIFGNSTLNKTLQNLQTTTTGVIGNKTEVRKDACDSCFVHNFKYVINNANVCSPANQSIDLLVLVLTIHKNVRSRQVLRDTWLSLSKNNTANVRHVFLLAKTDDQTLQKAVYNESAVYNDIIQEDFVDSYNNLTLKTIMGLKWTSTFCSNVKYVMKTDDDTWVNLPNLLRNLKAQNTSSDILYGACWRGAPHRHKQSKWYVPEHLYPHKTYPMFCSGTGYVMKTSTAEKIYKTSEHVPFFYLEDVYIGLCLKKIGGNAQSMNGFLKNKALKPCSYKENGVITSHYIRLEFIEAIWKSKC